MGDDGGKFAKAAKGLKEETRVTLREIAATCNSSESLEYERKQKRIFSVALLATLFGAIVFLLIDIFNGGLGWVRY